MIIWDALDVDYSKILKENMEFMIGNAEFV